MIYERIDNKRIRFDIMKYMEFGIAFSIIDDVSSIVLGRCSTGERLLSRNGSNYVNDDVLNWCIA